MDKPIEFLLLDFDREEETRLCVESIRKHAKFYHVVRLLHDSPLRFYHTELQEEGFIDYLHSNPTNLGCGVSTAQLFAFCESQYAFYVQVDQFLGVELTDGIIDSLISDIESNDNISYIDLAGNQGHGQFSERAAFIPVDWYNSIPKTLGGPGPLAHLKWTEECVQDYMRENKEGFVSYTMFGNNGKVSKRRNPDGSVWKHYTDEKKLFLLQGPVKEKYVYPKFTDEEWEEVLRTQKWEDGKIPEKEKEHSFVVWK